MTSSREQAKAGTGLSGQGARARARHAHATHGEATSTSDSADAGGGEGVREQLDALVDRVKELRKRTADATLFLTVYDLRRAQEVSKYRTCIVLSRLSFRRPGAEMIELTAPHLSPDFPGSRVIADAPVIEIRALYFVQITSHAAYLRRVTASQLHTRRVTEFGTNKSMFSMDHTTDPSRRSAGFGLASSPHAPSSRPEKNSRFGVKPSPRPPPPVERLPKRILAGRGGRRWPTKVKAGRQRQGLGQGQRQGGAG